MRFAVCDDEKNMRDCLKRCVRLLYPDSEIAGFGSGEALLDAEGLFDVVFLDIRMDGLSGMDTARELRRRGSDAALIFVTALEEYVFEAFDVGAFHYLVKPFDQAKLYEVLNRAVENRENIRLRRSVEEKCITVKSGAVTGKVYLSDIYYLEVFNRKVILHKADEQIEFYGKLSELEKSLGEDFVRSHRAYLVNLRYVLKYDAAEITLENGAVALMAKRKYPEFVKRYMRYIGRGGGEPEA